MKNSSSFITVILMLLFSPCFAQENFQVQKDTFVTNNNESIVRFYFNGNINSEVVSSSLVERYYPNGAIKKRYFEDWNGDINGLCLSFYPNGNIQEVYNMLGGRIVGPYISYHPNGQVDSTGLFKTIKCLTEINTKSDTIRHVSPITHGNDLIIETYIEQIQVGEWLFYDDRGNLIRRKYY